MSYKEKRKTVLMDLWIAFSGILITLNYPQFDSEKLYEAVGDLDDAWKKAKSLEKEYQEFGSDYSMAALYSVIKDFRIDIRNVYLTKLQLLDLLHTIEEIE